MKEQELLRRSLFFLVKEGFVCTTENKSIADLNILGVPYDSYTQTPIFYIGIIDMDFTISRPPAGWHHVLFLHSHLRWIEKNRRGKVAVCEQGSTKIDCESGRIYPRGNDYK